MEYGVLILVHVACAIFWGGSILLAGFFLIPAVLEAGPAGGQVMAGFMKRKFAVVMVAMGAVTLLSGLRLYMLRASAPGWMGSPEGIALGLGGLLAISAFSIGVLRQRPLSLKMAALAQEGRGAEIPPVAAQLAKTAKVVAWHVVAVIVLMAGHHVAAQFVVPAAAAPEAAAPAAVAPH